MAQTTCTPRFRHRIVLFIIICIDYIVGFNLFETSLSLDNSYGSTFKEEPNPQTTHRVRIMKTSFLLYSVLVVGSAVGGPLPKQYEIQQYLKNPAVEKFREYLRIDTSRDDNIQDAVEFWRRQASELGLQFAVYQPAGKPICVITWQGADPTLPSIMLNSHMDVVEVDEADWTYPPFSAHVDENGDIYARGAQDDKDVAIQYIEAIRRLRKENVTLQRTVHITLMPDEETGSFHGMVPFLDSQQFKALNVGFALDEGLTSADDTLFVTYVDKRPFQMKFTVHGTSAHGSTMPEDSAMEKLHELFNIISEYREEQKNVMRSGGMQNNLNVNIVSGGYAVNVVPSKMSLFVDMRLSVTENVTEITNLINSWVTEAGNKTEVEYIRRIDESVATAVDGSNPYYMAIQEAANDMSVKIKPVVCPATSDMIYLRSRGIPALGFSTKAYTTSRIHGANEYLNVATFLKGIDIYVGILKRLGNISSQNMVLAAVERNTESPVSLSISSVRPDTKSGSESQYLKYNAITYVSTLMFAIFY